jgi:pimeloyl-ACP methyl ester carboxylesterase
VLVGHPYGGLVARLYASTYPEDVSGLVLVDALSEGLRDAETSEQWTMQRKLMEGEIRESLASYPALEGIDPDRSFDQVRAAQPLRPLPLVVLSADRAWGPQIPSIDRGGRALGGRTAELWLRHRCSAKRSARPPSRARSERGARHKHEQRPRDTKGATSYCAQSNPRRRRGSSYWEQTSLAVRTACEGANAPSIDDRLRVRGRRTRPTGSMMRQKLIRAAGVTYVTTLRKMSKAGASAVAVALLVASTTRVTPVARL